MRVRNLWWSSLLVALAGTVVVAGPAGARGGADTRIVSNDAEYRAALTDLSATATGPALVVLDADVTVVGGADPTYTGAQPLTIDGDGHTLSGGGTRRVITRLLPGPLLTVTDITVTGGWSTDSGGAVSWPGPVTVTGATFEDNHVEGATTKIGGAITAEGLITIDESSFRDNSVETTSGNANGGAIYANVVGQVVITDSVFAVNSAVATSAGGGHGGAVFAISGADIERTVFLRNRVEGTIGSDGGALHSSNDADVASSYFATNRAEVTTNGGQASGGAINATTLTMTDSTLTDNDVVGVAPSIGSAVTGNSTVHVTDTTVSDNGASGEGAGGAIWSPHLTADHLTVASNTGSPANLFTSTSTSLTATAIGDPIEGANCNVVSVTGSANVADDNTCQLPAGNSNLSNAADLHLGPARNNGGPHVGASADQFFLPTRYPLSGSPVVDRQGVGSCTDTLDERQLTRPFGPKCDAGAIEDTYPPHAFTDVDAWVEDAVRWLASDVNDPPLVVGITPAGFRPADPIIRAQVVRLLYRLAGSPDASVYDPHPFTDVPPWVEDAVRWAAGEEIVTGETPTTFAPLDPITRGQVVRMVYRFAGSQDVSGIDPHPFTDVPGWIAEAVRWAANPDNALPIVTGITPTTFVPGDDITRGQVARMVYRLAITPAAWADPESAPATVPFIAAVVP